MKKLLLLSVLVIVTMAFAFYNGENDARNKLTDTTVTENHGSTALFGKVNGVNVSAKILSNKDIEELNHSSLSSELIQSSILVFLQLDTHSGDLSVYDLSKSTSIFYRNGKEDFASQWVPVRESDHHRHGILVFPKAENLNVDDLQKFMIEEIYGSSFEANWKQYK